MDSLTELLKKYYGYGANDELGLTESTSSDGGLGLDMGVQNQSLLGSDRRTNNTLSLMGLLGSPEALTGLGLISAGMKGQSIGEAALPSFVEGLKVSSTVRAMTKEQEQQKAIDEFGSQVPEQYKPLFKAFPKETMKLLLTPKSPTISGEALKVAGKLQGLNTIEFKEAFKKLSKVEQDLYNKEIIGNQDLTSMFLKEALEGGNLGNYAQKQKTAAAPVAPADIKSTSDFQTVKKTNPSATDAEIESFLKKKFPDKYK
jgi:hypothetical protein